jgi:hypothetical protein
MEARGLSSARVFGSSIYYRLRPIGLAFAPLIYYWLRPIGLAFAPLIYYWLRPTGLAFADSPPDPGEDYFSGPLATSLLALFLCLSSMILKIQRKVKCESSLSRG